MTTIEQIHDLEHVPAWDPDAIGRSYDEAKANIAVESGAWTQDEDEPWPETEKIDVQAIRPPAPTRPSSPPPPPAEPPVGRRAWRRWFSARA